MTLTGPTPTAHFGRGDAVDALLAAKADVRARAENSHGNTALHAAIAGAAGARVVAALLRHGSDVNAGDAGGHRPLHLAAVAGDAETVQTLLAAIARRLRGERP
jgi:ankyrin repeat protein